jgi:exoribonuclease-2
MQIDLRPITVLYRKSSRDEFFCKMQCETRNEAATVESLNDRSRLLKIACSAMAERDLLCDFSPAAKSELRVLLDRPMHSETARRDMRGESWCSIDNDESEDLDQLTLIKRDPNGEFRAFVAVADVDDLVITGSAIDRHARQNTTSIYTPPAVFPMLPEG